MYLELDCLIHILNEMHRVLLPGLLQCVSLNLAAHVLPSQLALSLSLSLSLSLTHTHTHTHTHKHTRARCPCARMQYAVWAYVRQKHRPTSRTGKSNSVTRTPGRLFNLSYSARPPLSDWHQHYTRQTNENQTEE